MALCDGSSIFAIYFVARGVAVEFPVVFFQGPTHPDVLNAKNILTSVKNLTISVKNLTVCSKRAGRLTAGQNFNNLIKEFDHF
jgi:hypothetical protein